MVREIPERQLDTLPLHWPRCLHYSYPAFSRESLCPVRTIGTFPEARVTFFIFVVWSWWRTDDPNLSSACKMINSNGENGKHLSQDPWMDSPKKHRHDFSPLRNVILGICSSSIATTNVSEKGLDRVIGRGEDLRSLLRRTKIMSFS